jgi:putative xylitol transport system ATP-binding protein
MTEPLLEVTALRKSFGGVAALKNGQFRLEPGSVHALCGGNGAGKSTFLSIVMGIQQRDAGVIRRNGKDVTFTSPKQALAAGISIIEQELSPVPAMSVAENMFLGREPLASFGRVDFRKMNADAQAILDRLHFSIKATDIMMDLSVARVQLVEIAKALSYEAEIIIMDEPTSALGDTEAQQLFDAIATLKAQGKGVVYVSHRLSEIFEIADSYTVFRDGEFIADGPMAETNRDQLIQMIVGRPLAEEFVKENAPTDQAVLTLTGAGSQARIADISLTAHAGEILVLYGLMGSGRSEICERIFGLAPQPSGQMSIRGTTVQITSPAEAIRHRIAFVTEDRKGSGLVLSAHVRANICLAQLEQLSVANVMRPGRETAAAKRMIDKFAIKTATDTLEVSNLSGGNQQKVVLGKWFLTDPEILLLDEPTRGVDVGAKREIYKVISDFAAAGGTVVMASSEIDEVLGMADRVIVLREGRIAGEITRADLSAEKLVHLAA